MVKLFGKDADILFVGEKPYSTRTWKTHFKEEESNDYQPQS